jgi:hypothetical protein
MRFVYSKDIRQHQIDDLSGEIDVKKNPLTLGVVRLKSSLTDSKETAVYSGVPTI